MTLKQRCSQIELLLLDVDGVLSDGRIIYSDDGREWKSFHVRDGAAVRLWQLAGKRAAILSGRASKVVTQRAGELDIDPVLQGIKDKDEAFTSLLGQLELDAKQVCFIGDDLPDVPVLRRCGFSVAVADACPEAKEAAHFVTRTPGGCGAVRETVELMLKAQQRWREILNAYWEA